MQSNLDAQLETPLFKLPAELHHQVVTSLEAKDILALRMTCHYFFALTHERGLWTALFNRMRAEQPLPCSRSEFEAMTAPQTERMLLAASRIEQSFLLRRRYIRQDPETVTEQLPTTLYALSFVSEFFLLSVVHTMITGTIQIWDTSVSCVSLPTTPYASFTFDASSVFSTHAVLVSADKSVLYVAFNKYTVPHHSVHIYSVPLCSDGLGTDDQRTFVLEADFPVHAEDTVKYIDPGSCRALVHRAPTSVDVLNWIDGTRSEIAILPDKSDGLWEWNGVTALRFCGPYVLCFRLHSVEAYPLPRDPSETAEMTPLPVLQHTFPSVTFNRVSLSRLRCSAHPSGDVFTIFMLSRDIYKETFHYQITVTTTPVPSMSLKLLAHMNTGVSNSVSGNGLESWCPSNDMFASAWALGSAGLRGIWVGGCVHEDPKVVAFTTHPRNLRTRVNRSPETLNESDEPRPCMNGAIVSEIRLSRHRDYIKACTVSDLTGRIALGSRTGSIWLL